MFGGVQESSQTWVCLNRIDVINEEAVARRNRVESRVREGHASDETEGAPSKLNGEESNEELAVLKYVGEDTEGKYKIRTASVYGSDNYKAKGPEKK